MSLTPHYNMSDLVGLELYNHNTDQGENFNLAGEKHYFGVIDHCFQIIKSYFK